MVIFRFFPTRWSLLRLALGNQNFLVQVYISSDFYLEFVKYVTTLLLFEHSLFWTGGWKEFALLEPILSPFLALNEACNCLSIYEISSWTLRTFNFFFLSSCKLIVTEGLYASNLPYFLISYTLFLTNFKLPNPPSPSSAAPFIEISKIFQLLHFP